MENQKMAHLPGLLAFVLQRQQESNPGPGLLLILTIIGAFYDWRYLRAGGRPSSKRDKTMALSIAAVIAGFLVVLGLLGATGEGIARLTGFLFVVYVFAWEVGRGRMRGKY